MLYPITAHLTFPKSIPIFFDENNITRVIKTASTSATGIAHATLAWLDSRLIKSVATK